MLKNKTKHLEIAIFGAVVPHHNLVADQRSIILSELAAKIVHPKTIILLSPNHFLAGKGKIQTTSQDWQLNSGQLSPNYDVVAFLTKNNLATNESASFINEHGIYNILADIKKYFPESTLVPIIFKDVSQEQLSMLKQGLQESCNNCLVIASVDFSHYQPALLSQLHDDRSLRDLQTLNTSDILANTEVDSGPALALLTMWVRDHNTTRFILKNHTNSGIIAQDPDPETTTHIFGWYEYGDKVAPEQSVSFIFGGDVMFARMINHIFGNNFNDVFDSFGNRVFWGTDAAIINLEGAITSKPIVDNIQTNNLSFQFSEKIAQALAFLHLNAVSLANNHSDNAGAEGYTTTHSVLDKNNIQSFGGSTESGLTRLAQFKGQGINLTVIGINLTFSGQVAEAIVPKIAELKKDLTMRVIIMPHWGTEYISTHSPAQAKAAHTWIDAGADLVIGGHPHVIQDAELYRNVPIIYSLGNFLFDQAFSKDTQEGLLIAGKFTQSGLTFFALPMQSINYRPQLMHESGKNDILNTLYIPFKDYSRSTPAGTIIQIDK